MDRTARKLLIYAALVLAFFPGSAARAPVPDFVVAVDRSSPIGTSQLEVGVTHMQHSMDAWGDPAAVERGRTLLQQSVRYSNQHIMGFGADNPEPSPGSYNWVSLDARVQVARSLGLTQVITLCCAPDWMKGGRPGETDWSLIERAPLHEHYGDFAELARQVAFRYSDVRYFQVWNEFKGMWSSTLNNWDYIAYTELYNLVYAAVKSVNKENQVGGPYLVIEGTGSGTGFWGARPITSRNLQVIDYWLANMKGADFITIDRATRDFHDTARYTQAQLLSFTPLFGDVVRQIRSRTSLPIWWAEDYFVGSDDWSFQAVGLASMLYHHAINGASVSLRWAPEGERSGPFGGNDQNLFSSTLVAGGGQPYPNHAVYKIFHDHFGSETLLYQTSSSSSDLEVLASAAKTLLIHKRPTQALVRVDATDIALGAYEVRVIDAEP